MKRAFGLLFSAAVLVNPVMAADLGGPKIPPLADAVASFRPAIWSGCYVDGSAAGHIVRSDFSASTVATAGVGFGCDHQVGKWVTGGRLGYDIGREDFRSLSVGGRVGFTLNPHALVYGLATLSMDGVTPRPANSVLSLGGGAELFVLTSRASVFMEVTKDAKQFGTAKAIDESWVTRLGARVRF